MVYTLVSRTIHSYLGHRCEAEALKPSHRRSANSWVPVGKRHMRREVRSQLSTEVDHPGHYLPFQGFGSPPVRQ